MGDWRLNDTFSFGAQVGTSTGHGKTGTQDVSETQPGTNNGTAFALHGTGNGPDFSFGNGTNNRLVSESAASR